MIVVCVNGVALAGKDSFVNRVKALRNVGFPDHSIVTRERQPIKCYSTIDPVKKVYKEFFGWNGDKTPEHRKNLNVLKRIWIDVDAGPIGYLMNVFHANAPFCRICFVMVREFEEMEKTKALAESMGYKAYTLEVLRDGLDIPSVEQEFLDSHPKGYKYDFSIFNPTVDTFPDLPLLDIAAESWLQLIMNED